jgi:hypothetical protein
MMGESGGVRMEEEERAEGEQWMGEKGFQLRGEEWRERVFRGWTERKGGGVAPSSDRKDALHNAEECVLESLVSRAETPSPRLWLP